METDPKDQIKQVRTRLAKHGDAMRALRERHDLTPEGRTDEFCRLFEEEKAILRDLKTLIEQLPSLGDRPPPSTNP
jgi:hypothetical protein